MWLSAREQLDGGSLKITFEGRENNERGAGGSTEGFTTAAAATSAKHTRIHNNDLMRDFHSAPFPSLASGWCCLDAKTICESLSFWYTTARTTTVAIGVANMAATLLAWWLANNETVSLANQTLAALKKLPVFNCRLPSSQSQTQSFLRH